MFSEAGYRRLLEMGLNAEQRPVAAKAFQTIGDIMNRKAPPGQRVQRFEIQERRWSYHEAPDDPDYGENVMSVFFDVTRGGEAAIIELMAPRPAEGDAL